MKKTVKILIAILIIFMILFFSKAKINHGHGTINIENKTPQITG